jgi:hypothetical protein
MRCLVVLMFSLTSLLQAYHVPYKAVVHVPIADLLGQSILDFKLGISVRESYARLPLSSADKASVCLRIHQALFNEIVTVVEETSEEVCIVLPHVFYTTPSDKQEKNSFWTLKRNITPLAVLEEQHLNSACLPEEIDFKKGNMIPSNQGVITLWLPFKSSVTGKQYSVGTRFAQAHYKRITDAAYAVYEYDAEAQQFHMLKIPKKYCFQTGAPYTHQERQEAFVSLVKAWVRLGSVVPFVWGGCSFRESCFSDNYHIEHVRDAQGHVSSFWVRSEMRNVIQSGFDISGLVYRAAQICGIPYYYKNTTTAARYLAEKRTFGSLQEGDLVWVPYGLYIISNLKENKVIAACGYDPGYGRVVELPLGDVFNNIETFNELVRAINKEETFDLLKADGSVSRTVPDCKILSLSSVWD